MDLSALTEVSNFLTQWFSENQKSSIIGTSVALAALPMAYHIYLLYQFPGEVKFAFSWVPILGHALEFGTNPIGAIKRISEGKDGNRKEIVGLVLAGKRIHLINDPSSFKVVFKSKKELSFDTFTRDILINVFGGTKKTTHGPHIEAEPLSRTAYNKYLLQDEGCFALTERMQQTLARVVKSLPKDSTVKMLHFFNKIIYTASAAALFNCTFAEKDDVFDKFIDFDDMFALAVAGAPPCFTPKGVAGRECVMKHICQDRGEDVSEFIRHRYELFEGKFGYPERDLQANQLAILWASVGNTMPGTYWLLSFLMKTPAAMDAVMQELNDVLGEKVKDPDFVISYEEMQRLRVLDSAISEALRLSTGSLIMREVVTPCTVTLASGNTYRFRKGDNVGIFPPLIHRDEQVFPNSDEFQYDRFLQLPSTVHLTTDAGDNKESKGKDVSTAACFIPFGGGVSYCPGRKFARNEIKTLVAQLLLRFHLSFVHPEDARPDTEDAMDFGRAGLGIFQPKNGNVEIRVQARHA